VLASLAGFLGNFDLAEEAHPTIASHHKINHSRKRMTMRKLIESTLISLDGVIEAPERWANWDAEDTAVSLNELGNYWSTRDRSAYRTSAAAPWTWPRAGPSPPPSADRSRSAAAGEAIFCGPRRNPRGRTARHRGRRQNICPVSTDETALEHFAGDRADRRRDRPNESLTLTPEHNRAFRREPVPGPFPPNPRQVIVRR